MAHVLLQAGLAVRGRKRGRLVKVPPSSSADPHISTSKVSILSDSGFKDSTVSPDLDPVLSSPAHLIPNEKDRREAGPSYSPILIYSKENVLDPTQEGANPTGCFSFYH